MIQPSKGKVYSSHFQESRGEDLCNFEIEDKNEPKDTYINQIEKDGDASRLLASLTGGLHRNIDIFQGLDDEPAGLHLTKE
jgi:hypothetical protein